jgi:nicotinic acid phosphoribosyltransferase
MFVLSDTNLVDVKSPLNDLQVLYKGKDLIRENLRLHLYRMQIQNTGNTVILKDYFDDNDLWGIRVDSGTIVKIGQPSVTHLM